MSQNHALVVELEERIESYVKRNLGDIPKVFFILFYFYSFFFFCTGGRGRGTGARVQQVGRSGGVRSQIFFHHWIFFVFKLGYCLLLLCVLGCVCCVCCVVLLGSKEMGTSSGK